MTQAITWQNAEPNAQANRERFAHERVFVLDILASSGSGKTSVILALIEALRDEFNIAVVVGDVASRVDTRRINEQGIAAVRAGAGIASHLDGAKIAQVAGVLDLEELDLILVENTGDLAVPAAYSVGESATLVISSVSEGEDLPVRYPDAFQMADAVVLNKVDTCAKYGFDVDAYQDVVRQGNAQAPLFPLSATTGEGVDALVDWLADQVRSAQ